MQIQSQGRIPGPLFENAEKQIVAGKLGKKARIWCTIRIRLAERNHFSLIPTCPTAWTWSHVRLWEVHRRWVSKAQITRGWTGWKRFQGKRETWAEWQKEGWNIHKQQERGILGVREITWIKAEIQVCLKERWRWLRWFITCSYIRHLTFLQESSKAVYFDVVLSQMVLSHWMTSSSLQSLERYIKD